MEDQRNWTDASYKTYSTPLALPFPVEIRAGETVEQTVTLWVTRRKVRCRRNEPRNAGSPWPLPSATIPPPACRGWG